MALIVVKGKDHVAKNERNAKEKDIHDGRSTSSSNTI